MFYNVGRTIKILAKIFMWLGIGASTITGIYYWTQTTKYNEWLFVVGLLILIVGVLGSLVTGILLYGYGNLIEDTAKIRSKVCDDEDWYE